MVNLGGLSETESLIWPCLQSQLNVVRIAFEDWQSMWISCFHVCLYLLQMAFNAVTYLWNKKPLKVYGARMSESLLNILCHIINSEALIRVCSLHLTTRLQNLCFASFNLHQSLISDFGFMTIPFAFWIGGSIWLGLCHLGLLFPR